MGRSVRLIADDDEYDSKPGLRLVGVPKMDGWMAAREGLLIAHDIIEHQNGPENIGTVWDELEALGGIWHVRGRWGDLMIPSIHSPHVNMASDLTRMLRDWDTEGRSRSRPTRASDYDDDFRDIIEEARRGIRKEYDEEDRHPELVEAYLTEAMHRMRIGFRKTWRRFGGSGFQSNNQFRAIKESCDQICRYLDFAGQQFVLTYGNGEASIREIYDDA